MKKIIISVLAVSLAGQVHGKNLSDASLMGDEIIQTSFGEVALEHNYISDQHSQLLFDQMDIQRAAQAYIWSTPIVSSMSWREEQGAALGVQGRGQFFVANSLKEKRGIVTGNLTTPYILNFDIIGEQPLVVEFPAGKTAGMVLDMWQRPVVDFGLTGPDKGQGGTYVIIGPEHNPDDYRKEGVFVAQSVTNGIFMGTRFLSDYKLTAARFEKELKIYEFGKKPAKAKFYAGIDREWSATAPRGMLYWQRLHRVMNESPVRDQDKPWMAMLKPLGLEVGKAFKPSEKQQKLLVEGGNLGELMLRNMQTNPRFSKPYWENTHWYKSFDFDTPQITDTHVQLDERAVWFYEAVTSSKGMVYPTPGKGQVYMTAKRDSNGDLLRADRTYRLHVPANVPVKQFWSVTLYSENTRRPYNNGGTDIQSIGLGSRTQDLKYNDDGSVDLYIGHEAPEGMESNFLKTAGEDGWFVYFRLYAPTEAFFDKSFSLGDFEKLPK